MLLTKENDYAIRIVRAIKDGEKHTIKTICQGEEIPEAFAYKIVKKLQKSGIVKIERGVAGGCQLTKGLSEFTLYDLIVATDHPPTISQCLEKSCSRNKQETPCRVHQELEKIQEVLIGELKGRKLQDVF